MTLGCENTTNNCLGNLKISIEGKYCIKFETFKIISVKKQIHVQTRIKLNLRNVYRKLLDWGLTTLESFSVSATQKSRETGTLREENSKVLRLENLFCHHFLLSLIKGVFCLH